MLKKWLMAMLALGMGIAAPAAAQGGRSLNTVEREPSTPRDIRVLHGFARCVADRRTRWAREALTAAVGSEESSRRLLALADRGVVCAPPGVLRFSGVLFAGGVAERLLQVRLGGGALAPRVALDSARPALQSRDETETMSLCTVMAAPAQVQALLATVPATREEAAAVRALTPQVGQCLAAGATARLNRPAIRSLLAIAAYRVVEHGAPAAP